MALLDPWPRVGPDAVLDWELDGCEPSMFDLEARFKSEDGCDCDLDCLWGVLSACMMLYRFDSSHHEYWKRVHWAYINYVDLWSMSEW